MSDTVSGEGQDLGVWGWVKSIVSWLVLLAVLAILALTIVIPRLTGATPYTVLTGSMEPNYPPGTLIVVKPEDPAALQAGDVITFQKESGKLDVVTHRIIEVRENARGEKSFVTQGDANPSRDMNPVVPEQIRGKLWYSVPFMGYVNSVVTGQQRSIMIVVVVGGLLAYAGWMFVSGFRDRSRKGKDEGEDDPADATPEAAAGPVQPTPPYPQAPLGRPAPVRHGAPVTEADTIVMPRIGGGHGAHRPPVPTAIPPAGRRGFVEADTVVIPRIDGHHRAP
ncbi:signal peptidase I [Rhodococcus tukisamuensis]|uniref:Signal peptidase I n=1 Tax=Rhodococcus tukisamuensis TaxID=168276 RepID=A0A1G6SDB2_9NOCA|nr:signal peptidase I [Rhodococcus tukisamuensis]SDD14878.1 signal peptidase, endoplasmic reticulum-type [Rhodococcus tukisamuensis]